ncbi:tetratricopeptide repeat protein [Empedobacter sp. 225-1]|uniref:tetratricopeptide repeat protein n=1 Tax=unclassified Empedobacter TaxID=2643773 RepID=UPI0025773549|nr:MULTISPECIES: tetratricopeptide repeat protein [unclassified Empedobacter]MDM1521842.1 tetratricopeptide repeat protein [Empedobacter sp. 225-1]MDM1541660.1 tetratricopeptide repeat protein [Empedobacter sp. 189-2]
MDEDFFNNELIERFEQMLENREYKYYDSEDLVEIIEFYIEVNDSEYAKRALDFAEKMHPENIEIKIKKIEYLLLINELKRSAKLIQELKVIAANELDYLLVQARFWGMKKMSRKAIRFYEEALSIDDDETDFICNCIGNEFLNLDEVQSALIAFRKALKFNPENDYSFYSIIQCFEEIHNPEECIDFLKDFIDDNPYSEVAWLQLGLLYNHKKMFKEAINALDYVIAINPNSIVGHTNKAFSFEELGDYNKAIETLEETLEYDDSPALTHFKIGELYEKLKKPQKALKAYHIAIKEDPQLDKVWAKSAALYDKMGNLDEAEYYIQRAIELNDDNSEYYTNSTYYFLKQMKFEEALSSLVKLVELKPLVFNTWFAYVETLIAIGEYEQAIAVLLTGALKNFNRAEFFYQLSNVYYLIDEDRLGNEALRNALSMDITIKKMMFENYPILQDKINDIFENDD